MNIGDFSVSDFALGFARDKQAERSDRARGVDEEERAPITTDAGAWAENPNRLDFPGVDTPAENPSVLPKDLKHPAKTDVAPKAKDESRRGAIPSPERNTDAPEPETARLAATDISLAPEEAFEGVATGSQKRSNRVDRSRQFAGDAEADIAFDQAERERLERRRR